MAVHLAIKVLFIACCVSLNGVDASYIVTIKTSNYAFSGTDAHVHIRLFGHKNQGGSQAVWLNDPNKNDFETGQTDRFAITDSLIPDVGVVDRIQLWHDGSGFGPHWHLEWVRIVDYNRGSYTPTYYFHCDCEFGDVPNTKTLHRPVDGGWGNYGSYGSCSRSCGTGRQTRRRQCNNPPPKGGGADCSGSSTSTRTCILRNCPVHGGWSPYSAWQSCTAYCGGGTQTAIRTCTNPRPMYDGAQCTGSSTKTQSCATNPCPVHGGWSDWSNWQSCSVSCGGGWQTRERTCTSPAPAYGGLRCYGLSQRNQTCNTNACPVNGGWSDWTGWSNCTESCGGGDQVSTRTCTKPARAHGGLDCVGEPTKVQACNIQPCIVNGGWSMWSNWTVCSLSCGGGIQSSNRTCTLASCEGNSTRYQPCNSGACPVNGNWTDWTEWGSCSASCDGGTQTSTRECSNPPQSNGGKDCQGPAFKSQPCNTDVCPVNGSWTSWSEWTPCSVTCGGGVETSTRSCSEPPPSGTGLDCEGNATATRPCNTDGCLVDGGLTTWSEWTNCSKPCDGGEASRTRTCTNPAPAFGGHECMGSTNQTRPCNLQLCPDDGGWTLWSKWTACSLKCGSGTKTKERTCTNPAPSGDGLDCIGQKTVYKSCNTQPCNEVIIEKVSSQAVQQEDGEGAFNTGGIVGLSVGLCIALLIIGIIIGVCITKRMRKREAPPADDFSVAYINNIYEEIPGAQNSQNSQAASVAVNPNWGHQTDLKKVDDFDEKGAHGNIDDDRYMDPKKSVKADVVDDKNIDFDMDEDKYLEPRKSIE